MVVHSTGTRKFENVDSALFERNGSNDSGDGKTVLGDSKLMKIKVGA